MDFKKYKISGFATFCLVLNLVLVWLDAGVSAAEKPSCVTDKCHATMGKEEYVHGPVAVNQCAVCHQPAASDKFKATSGKGCPSPGQPITDTGKLCNVCHESSYFYGKVVHPPAEKGYCTGCHNPHQSPYEFMLRQEGANVCLICHDKEFAVGEFSHSPVDKACTECHSPHRPWEKIPVGRKLDQACYMCHAEQDRDMKSYRTWHTELYCFTCHHTKHGYVPQCLECHQRHTDKVDMFLDACVTCHPPHKALQVVSPADTPKEACAVCHRSQYEILKQSPKKHSALQCTKCHPDKHRTTMSCSQCHVEPNKPNCTANPPKNMLCGQCHGPAHALRPEPQSPAHGNVR
jgi:predicted CXXCH cytochrome family protein